MIKNDLVCGRCMYKNVPTNFSPCLGCNSNMDRLARPAVEEKENQKVRDNHGGMYKSNNSRNNTDF